MPKKVPCRNTDNPFFFLKLNDIYLIYLIYLIPRKTKRSAAEPRTRPNFSQTLTDVYHPRHTPYIPLTETEQRSSITFGQSAR